MKKSIFIILFAGLLFYACGAIRVSDVTSLSMGMTQSEVNNIMGIPVRKLSSSYTQDGMFEAFEYHTYRNEAYAVEFHNGRLSRYDFMYEDIPPTTVAPPPGRPLPPPRPVYPNRPPNHDRPKPPPTNGKPGNERPGTGNSRPSGERPGNNRPGTSRPENTRPGNKKPNKDRPTNGNSGTATRPTYGEGNKRPTYNSSEKVNSEQKTNSKTFEEKK